MTIALIATGGTIACTTHANGSLLPTISGEQLAAALAGTGTDIDVIEFRSLDSSAITLDDLDELVALVHAQLARPDIDGILITHGTDSMEDTAMALAVFHPGTAPVVLTGAQRPFDHPDADGPDNLRGALAQLATGDKGVSIHFGGRTIPALGARKRHTSALDGFESMPVAETSCLPLPLAPLADHPVAVVAAYPGADGTLVDAASATFPGIVIEALGSGNMGAEMGRAVARALEHGTAVVISTRVPYGATSLAYGGDGGGSTLGDLGAVHAHTLRPGQARILLAAALATGTPLETAFSPVTWNKECGDKHYSRILRVTTYFLANPGEVEVAYSSYLATVKSSRLPANAKITHVSSEPHRSDCSELREELVQQLIYERPGHQAKELELYELTALLNLKAPLSPELWSSVSEQFLMDPNDAIVDRFPSCVGAEELTPSPIRER